MSKEKCCKEKIVGMFYKETVDNSIIEHITVCNNCAKYYKELAEASKKLEILNQPSESNFFAVKRIVNLHLAKKERQKYFREAIWFAAFSFFALSSCYATLLAIDFKAVIIFQLLILFTLPIVLLPILLKRMGVM